MSDLYTVIVQHNLRLRMRDGVELSANVWRPTPREPGEKFPAIFELIPYRKDDWRYNSDMARMTYFAQRGYVGCRVDVRGTGSSGGIALDEYTEAETQDGYEIVEWLGTQPWSNGNVGMWGISYGGFTSIQVAMLQPPHLKAIIPMYATDDRYNDDVHYVGGCPTASEWSGYALAMLAMNALPPKAEYVGADWLKLWKERLEQTPLWTLNWRKHQTDDAYWRRGSLAPDYGRITCAIFSIAGWMDGYTNPAVRMQEKCVNAAGRKTLIGNWVHSYPDSAYPGPNLDHLHEMTRFFDYWLKGLDNGVMAEPALTFFRREYTPPEAFPAKFNGAWASEGAYPIERTQHTHYYLDKYAVNLQSRASVSNSQVFFPHRPTHGTHAAACWGAGGAPNGLARDLRPDEALTPVYTSEPLTETLDIFGFPEAVLYLSSTAPVAHVVVRLTDVAPDGASALVTVGVLNLTHRESHAQPTLLTPGEIYKVRVPMKAAGYRFLTGHRIRLSIASAYWPVIWPSPYPADNIIYCGPATPSHLSLPVISPSPLAPLSFKTTPPELLSVGGGSEEPPIWQITEDVMNQSVTVTLYSGGTSLLPDEHTSLFESERVVLTAHHHDPAQALLFNESVMELKEGGHQTHVRATGTIRSDASQFHFDAQLVVTLNGEAFFQKAWAESIPRNWT